HVVETYLRHQEVEVVWIPYREGRTDLDALKASLDEGVAAVVVQQPNFFGVLEPVDEMGELAHQAGALYVACVEPISLGLLRPPGQYGADIVVGEAQPLGNAIQFGGPYVGFYATRESLIRRAPGRIAGQTVDAEGQRA